MQNFHLPPSKFRSLFVDLPSTFIPDASSALDQFCCDLLSQVLQNNNNITTVSMNDNVDPYLPLTLLESHTSLVSLSLYTPNIVMNFSKLTQLQTLVYRSDNLTSFQPLVDTLPVSVTTLDLHSCALTSLANISTLEYVEELYLTVALTSSPTSDPFPELPPNLQLLSISHSPYSTLNMSTTSSKSPSGKVSLRTLTLVSPQNMVNITQLPDTLTSFTCSSCSSLQVWDPITAVPASLELINLGIGSLTNIPATLAQRPNLTSVSLSCAPSCSDMPIIPSFASTKLSQFSVSNMPLPSDEVESVVCTRLAPSTLSSLVLSNLVLVTHVPSCIATSFPNLQYLYITRCANIPSVNASSIVDALPSTLRNLSMNTTPFRGAAFDWDLFVAKVPHLRSLDMSNAGLTGTFPSQLRSLTGLSSLYLSSNQLVGAVPTDLFASLPSLELFLAYSNQLTGTVPWYGFESMTTFSLGNNFFTDFPSIYGGAPHLSLMSIPNNRLATMPDDVSFQLMPNLVSVDFSGNPQLVGPVPAFWADHPRITEVFFGGCSFSGPLPSPILSPFIETVDFSSQPYPFSSYASSSPSICGPLPEMSDGMGFNRLLLSNQLLSGPIPRSWSANLTLLATSTLDLHSNFLNGTLPNPFFTPYSTFALQLDLSSNSLEGQMPRKLLDSLGPQPLADTHTTLQ